VSQIQRLDIIGFGRRDVCATTLPEHDRLDHVVSRNFQFSLSCFVVYLVDIPLNLGSCGAHRRSDGDTSFACIGITTVTILWVQRILAFGGPGENKDFWAVYG
jgi:hypothetical protein